MSKNIIVGMSGGVDSSVTAALLLEQGHLVTGVFMKNWDEDDGTDECTALEDLADAQQVCDTLGIELKTINFASEYWDEVFEVFLAEFAAGRTPNPDILCNKHVKFKAFLNYATEDLGAEFIATGHYARISQEQGQYFLLKGLDPTKEQSYFLYTLGQKALAKTLFPIGHLHKTEIRQIAEKYEFSNHHKKDSTGICFIGERKFTEFLQRYLPTQPGEMHTPEGQYIAQHSGLMYYTYGQRQGLRIGGVKNAPDEPWYVLDKDLDNNILIVGQGHDHPLMLHNTLEANQLDWCSNQPLTETIICSAKTRYRQADQSCKVIPLADNRIKVVFEQQQRAITPGQSVVFYSSEICLGGGIIETRDNQ
ncbi:MAG: tRNA 2-thiouridine(34) synthase MnmA [Gammaproteobacteria bacterium]|mgnify:FL=1|jgi:tRNA-uridine 2-sulfurtransferase|nr:tRNA 2-thiouridine(34) synthase MnmA [Gammaproteobacteria bacterium]MBT5221693.1 tRNA 2-thiouridine(34) synthase MnmA [Gammaproteobacteria bacterium]MBT5826395.1 tRNA 2-thiouridine(34) synthase MnmA [Gammaproteobacteria bacterium]MBT5965847.1 tRNA 2-thiouridine(34) synthase MnmA [Gammaproteobacteria bacterium]MBT6420182.1 tRNA 2-thiouridine(34) synthase MnmA [Gammaproteobacteria bacterium]